MDSTTIERWIKNIGRRRDVLVAEGAIPGGPLTELYKGSDRLSLEPVSGLELSFWAETERLETVNIGLVEVLEGTGEYRGELPKPYRSDMNQSDVRSLFGTPMESKPPTKLPLNTIIGGWDSYPLDPSINSNVKVIFTYTETLRVRNLTFKMIDKDQEQRPLS
tara:strand:- start:10360 stop:10848 length:489 start_codon:yes stop_codon:yes gene_type:complete